MAFARQPATVSGGGAVYATPWWSWRCRRVSHAPRHRVQRLALQHPADGAGLRRGGLFVVKGKRVERAQEMNPELLARKDIL